MKTPTRSSLLSKARGQGMTEYIIIVALIAIAAIGVITLFGDNLRTLYGEAANALAGETDVKNRTTASKGAALEKRKLTNFSADNSGY